MNLIYWFTNSYLIYKNFLIYKNNLFNWDLSLQSFVLKKNLKEISRSRNKTHHLSTNLSHSNWPEDSIAKDSSVVFSSRQSLPRFYHVAYLPTTIFHANRKSEFPSSLKEIFSFKLKIPFKLKIIEFSCERQNFKKTRSLTKFFSRIPVYVAR